MLALIESIVRETIKHNESEPIASDTATACANRDDETGPRRPSKPVRPSKPAVPDDRIMVEFPLRPISSIVANHPRRQQFHRQDWQYWGGYNPENGEMAATSILMPAI
jgi:hypothetical protein